VEPKLPATQRIGRFLFRARSLTPVPIVALILSILYAHRSSVRSMNPAVDHLLDLAGFCFALSGQAMRAWVLGQAPPQTSGQGNELEAATLNTRGPYARVRNPLYLGNFLIVVALLLIAGDPWVGLIGVTFFAMQYAFIVATEEAFLRQRFGAAFDAYAAEVPRWWPRLIPASREPLAAKFDARRALFKEHNPLTAWLSGALALIAWKASVRRGAEAVREIAALIGIEVIVLVAFGLTKAWKHGRFDRRTRQ